MGEPEASEGGQPKQRPLGGDACFSASEHWCDFVCVFVSVYVCADRGKYINIWYHSNIIFRLQRPTEWNNNFCLKKEKGINKSFLLSCTEFQRIVILNYLRMEESCPVPGIPQCSCLQYMHLNILFPVSDDWTVPTRAKSMVRNVCRAQTLRGKQSAVKTSAFSLGSNMTLHCTVSIFIYIHFDIWFSVNFSLISIKILH